MNSRSATAFIIFQNKLLLFLRDNTPKIKNPNMWSLPGGLVEDGETPEEGLCRELQEEISIIPRSITYLGKWHKPSGQVGSYYVAYLTEDEVSQLRLGEGEGQKIEFFKQEDIPALPLSGMIKRTIESYPRALKKILSEERVLTSDLGLES